MLLISHDLFLVKQLEFYSVTLVRCVTQARSQICLPLWRIGFIGIL